jgi:hypothetical protein
VAAAAEANAADLRMALRMIEAARPEQPERAHHEHVSTPTEQPPTSASGQGEQPSQARPVATPNPMAPKSRWRQLLWGRS